MLTPERHDGVRASPSAGVLLTDAEIDHTAALLGGPDAQFHATRFVFGDRAGRGVLTYVPGLARLDAAVLTRFATSHLVTLGISCRSARDTGHVPLAGLGGTLGALARIERPRKALVHINNTNPILLEGSPEHNAVSHAGTEVANDGLETEL